MTTRNIRLARWLKKEGFAHPVRLVRAARAAGIRVETALALISMETGNGRNVYGHDAVNTDNTYRKGGPVTKRNYLAYKRARKAYRAGMQGVGPCQLTWWQIQDNADALAPRGPWRGAGCAHPYYNMLYGFRHLKQLAASTDNLRVAFERYNGTGSAAREYSRRAMRQRGSWAHRLRGAGF